MKSSTCIVLGCAVLRAGGALHDPLAQSYPHKAMRAIRPHPPASPGDVQARGTANEYATWGPLIESLGTSVE